MKMKIGPTKTAIVSFLCPANVRAAKRAGIADPYAAVPDITLTDGTTVIPNVAQYRHLGLTLPRNLSLDPFVESTATSILHAYAQFFAYSAITPLLSPCSRVDILREACPSFMLGLVPPTPANTKTLDNALLRLARVTCGLHDSAPSDLARCESGIPSALFIFARERTRILLSLALSPFQDTPATRALRGYGTGKGTWLHDTLKLLRAHGTGTDEFANAALILGVRHRQAHAADVPRAAAVYARKCVAVSMGAHDAPAAATTMDMAQRPAPGPPTQHAQDLAFGHHYSFLELSTHHGATRMSDTLPNGAGCPLFRPTLHVERAIIMALGRARTGALCLAMEPLAPRRWLLEKESADGDAWSRASRGRRCPACRGTNNTDVYHIINECTHPAVVTARLKLQQQAASFIPSLAALVRDAAKRTAPGARPPPPGTTWLPGATALAAHNWTSGTNKRLLLHLVIAKPFPAACVLDPAATIASHLGHLFDNLFTHTCQVTCLHPVYNVWVPWAGRHLLSVVREWARVVDA